MKNHYETLKVTRDAPTEIIRAAYKSLSQKYHPDKNHTTDQTELMTEINLAYQILSNLETRRQYDQQLKVEEHKQYAEEADRQRRQWAKEYPTTQTKTLEIPTPTSKKSTKTLDRVITIIGKCIVGGISLLTGLLIFYVYANFIINKDQPGATFKEITIASILLSFFIVMGLEELNTLKSQQKLLKISLKNVATITLASILLTIYGIYKQGDKPLKIPQSITNKNKQEKIEIYELNKTTQECINLSPLLNPQSPYFDQRAVYAVDEQYTNYRNQGFNPKDSMTLACRDLQKNKIPNYRPRY